MLETSVPTILQRFPRPAVRLTFSHNFLSFILPAELSVLRITDQSYVYNELLHSRKTLYIVWQLVCDDYRNDVAL